MPIGKQSINRVAKKADAEQVTPVVAEQPTETKKPSAAKKGGADATAKKTTKSPSAASKKKAEHTPVTTPAETELPAVTEHVIANIDPEVVEKVVGTETPAPKDGKVKLTDPMPSYLL